MRSGEKEEPKVPAKNGKGIRANSTPKNLCKGQLILRVVEHVRKNIPGPSKFASKWEGPYIIKEAHYSGYYYLAKEDETSLVDPINKKWLKQYYE